MRNLPAPTFRFYLLATALAIPLALGSVHAGFLGVAIAGAIALIAAVLADYSAAAPPSRIEVKRLHNPRLYLAADNPIDLEVSNNTALTFQARLRDTPPSPFHSSAVILPIVVPPFSTARTQYITKPLSRGEFAFDVAILRWLTPWDLLWRQRTYPLQEKVVVYPNLLEVQKYDLLTRRGMLQQIGLRTIRHVDRGSEFETLRDYQPDDDFRRVNWKATARKGKPITNVYQTERSQRLVIMLDLGRMMLSRVGDLSRLDVAVNSSLLLAYVALTMGDRVGLLSFGDGIQSYMPPRSGKTQFYAILEQLHNLRARPIESNYGEAFNHLRRELRGRSLITLFTDLSNPEVASLIARHMALLSRHHLPICVSLNDPLVAVRAKASPESGSELYGKLAALRSLEERAVLIEDMRQAGVTTIDAPADEVVLATIDRYLKLKEHSLL